MKQFTITISDDKVDLFVELMKSITFVKEVKEENVFDIPEEHKTLVKERVEKYKNSSESYLEWDEIEEKIKSDK